MKTKASSLNWDFDETPRESSFILDRCIEKYRREKKTLTSNTRRYGKTLVFLCRSQDPGITTISYGKKETMQVQHVKTQ